MQQTIFTSKYFDNKLRSYSLDHVKNLEYKQQILKRWISAIDNGTIKFSKETEIDLTFLNDIFGEVLDYEYQIDKENINLIPKSSIESKEPDAILGFFTHQIRYDIRVVIELKDSETDLDRIQNRLEKISPVTQAFEYGRKAGEQCKWVIVSNIKTIRLYNKESDNYELFNLSDLQETYFLKRFFYLLHKDRLLHTSGESPVDTLYRERQEEELKITKEFYTKYKEIRVQLFQNLHENNTEIDKLVLLEKAQKLLDRIIFVCFCSDLEILPSKILQKISTYFLNQEYFYDDIVLWLLVKQLFKSVDNGNRKIFKLNGGLFAADEILDKLKIGSEILIKVFEIAEFDFRSDINVNILGHIFEQSISDLEKLKKDILNPTGFENPLGFTNGKRKELGIFYTPDYITKYIVKESIGTWLSDARIELGENDLPILTDKDYDLIKITKQGTVRTNDKIEKNKKFWNEYLQRLLAIKILDPACGSGAFLVAAFDFLLNEYLSVQKEIKLLNPPEPPESFIPKMKGGLDFKPTILFDIEEHIIKNNLFGVDINFESVEITKLAMWLKTVKRGKILSDIENNIQCGNSLIDDKKISGDLAFCWNERFKTIIDNGGFDILLGNPPYGTSFTEHEKKYLLSNYQNVPDFEVFYYFISRGLDLLNNRGIIGYIFPNTFLSRQFGEKFRMQILNQHDIISITDLSDDKIFEDAQVRTCITIISKNIKDILTKFSVYNHDEKVINTSKFLTKAYLEDNISNWQSLFTVSKDIYNIILKIKQTELTINNVCEVSQGLIPYDKYRGHDEYTIKNRIWHSNQQKDETYRKEVKGADISKYDLNWNGELWISYGDWLAAPREQKFFTSPRILIREICENELICTYTEDEYYNSPSIINVIQKDKKIELKYILAILNSKLMGWYHFNTSPKAKKGLFPKILVSDVRKIPIPKIPFNKQKLFIEKVDLILLKSKEFNELNDKFLIFCQSQFPIQKFSERLKDWYNLEFNEFMNELNKLKIKVDANKVFDFIDIYKREQLKINEFRKIIENTDKEIDSIVYNLYQLNESEIEQIAK